MSPFVVNFKNSSTRICLHLQPRIKLGKIFPSTRVRRSFTWLLNFAQEVFNLKEQLSKKLKVYAVAMSCGHVNTKILQLR